MSIYSQRLGLLGGSLLRRLPVHGESINRMTASPLNQSAIRKHRYAAFRLFHSTVPLASEEQEPRHRRQNRRVAARNLLHQTRTKNIKPGLVCQKVEEIFLGILTTDCEPDDGPLALDLLNASLKNADLGRERLIPRLFSLSCQVMIRSRHPRALMEVQRQLQQLIKFHGQYLGNDLQYNSHHFNDAFAEFIIHSVLTSSQTRVAIGNDTKRQIRKFMKQLQELYDDPSVPLVTSSFSCNSFVMYLGNEGQASEAYRLLKWMVGRVDQHPTELVPRVSSFTSVISAFAKRREPEKSLEILQWMLKSSEHIDSVPPPNQTCCNALLDA